MTVYQLKDRRSAWAYEFVKKGKRYRGRCVDLDGRPVKTQRAALDAEIREKAYAEVGVRPEDQHVDGCFTIAHAAARYRQRSIHRGRSPEHLRHQAAYLREILAFFGEATPFAEIRQEQIDAYIVFCSRQTVTQRRRGNSHAGLANVGDRAAANGPRSTRYMHNYLACLRGLISIAGKMRDRSGQPILVAPLQIGPLSSAPRCLCAPPRASP